jgi:hypothetical protein
VQHVCVAAGGGERVQHRRTWVGKHGHELAHGWQVGTCVAGSGHLQWCEQRPGAARGNKQAWGHVGTEGNPPWWAASSNTLVANGCVLAEV